MDVARVLKSIKGKPRTAGAVGAAIAVVAYWVARQRRAHNAHLQRLQMQGRLENRQPTAAEIKVRMIVIARNVQ